ncbi:MAG: TatD family hydrolase [Candidatus Saccharimonadales bacterium]
MELVDTHCHIQSAGPGKRGERATRQLWAKSPHLSTKELVDNAEEAEVTKLIVVGCDAPDSQLAIDFVATQKNCFASVGIHPHEAKEYVNNDDLQNEFASLLEKPKVVSLGECGLDYYYNHSNKKDQIPVLRFQIELALKHKLPIIFHVREAFDDFWPIFDSYNGIRGVVHSFTDNQENLNKAIDRGLYIGVNGIATFAKKPEQIEVYKSVPLTSLLLETDAPFLTPHPFRGTINEPKHIRSIASYLAKLHEVSVDEVANITTSNAKKLFGI